MNASSTWASPGQQYRASSGDFESPHAVGCAADSFRIESVDVGCDAGVRRSRAVRQGLRRDRHRPVSPARGCARFEFHPGGSGQRHDPRGRGSVRLRAVAGRDRASACRPRHSWKTLRNSRRQDKDTRVIVSTGNVAFFITRFMLLSGFFHYGARGILDLTHTRLFTFATIRKAVRAGQLSCRGDTGYPGAVPAGFRRHGPGSLPGRSEPVPHQDFPVSVFLSNLPGVSGRSRLSKCCWRGRSLPASLVQPWL